MTPKMLAAMSAALLASSFASPSPLDAQAATQAGQASVAVPATAAGTVLQQWLAAFNSGDPNTLNTYYQRYEPTKTAESQMGFRNQTGGFDLLSVGESQPLHLA